MDVLNAELFPVEDRLYRLILPVQDSSNNPEEEEDFRPVRTYREDEDDDYDPDLPIVHQGDKFYISFHIPNLLIKHIIGQKHKTMRMLEQHGGTINLRGGGRNDKKEDAVITISGSSKHIVSITYDSAMSRLNLGRLRMESTHFISLPMNSPEIQESFLNFREEVLKKHRTVRGIDESIFQKPSKLHVTIVTLVLLDERDNQNAIGILNKCLENTLDDFNDKEFVVRVQGIECMNDDPAEVDVLYAKVEELDGDNRLQIIADNIMKGFCDANLSKRQHDKVKLHITLMNTLFRAKLENKDEDNEDDELRQTFDARPLFKNYEDYDFGQIVVNEIDISVRYTEASDGYYMAIKKVKLDS